MPKAMEDDLKRRAAAKGLKGKERDAYVYGTMQAAMNGGRGANLAEMAEREKSHKKRYPVGKKGKK